MAALDITTPDMVEVRTARGTGVSGHDIMAGVRGLWLGYEGYGWGTRFMSGVREYIWDIWGYEGMSWVRGCEGYVWGARVCLGCEGMSGVRFT